MSIKHYEARTFRPHLSVDYLIKRSLSLLGEAIDPLLETQGFTPTQYHILVWLRDGVVRNPRDISLQFGTKCRVFTREIDHLTARRLLETARRDRNDRRKIDLHLTSAGLDAVGKLIPLVVERLNFALMDFSSSELQELVRLLHKFNSTMHSVLSRSLIAG
jgi:DNA-binding MarR family transcriptional regulator